MELCTNPLRGMGLPPATVAPGHVSSDASEAMALARQCPAYSPTPLRPMPDLAQALGVASLMLKDESARMGLGSFKALGAAYVIAREAVAASSADAASTAGGDLTAALRDRVYACASAGNHGLSVAAGARAFGASAVVYLADSVPEAFAERLRGFGATVVRPGGTYEDAMAAVEQTAGAQGWVLLSDSSWPGYTDIPRIVMEGYLIMAAETVEHVDEPPTHVLLQGGVGGFAAAMTALFRARWGDGPTIIVVEPEAAPCLLESVRGSRPVTVSGPDSTMGRLDCKAPSHLALAELARNADYFVTVDDSQAAETVDLLARHGIATTPSGAAGVAGLQHAGEHRTTLGLSESSRVLAFITERPENVS